VPGVIVETLPVAMSNPKLESCAPGRTGGAVAIY